MAEKIPADLVVTHLAENAGVQAYIGSAVYPGVEMKSRDPLDYLPCVTVSREPMGRSLYGRNLGYEYVMVESWHVSSINEARECYVAVQDALDHAQIKGTVWAVDVTEYIGPEDDVGWDNKCFVVRGVWKLLYRKES